MKQFIKKIFLFSSSILVFLISVIVLFHYLHVFPINERNKNTEFEIAFEKGNFEMLLLGNSKIGAAINKEVLEKKMNMSAVLINYVAADLSVSKLTLESYLNICKVKPKIVFLEVSWFSFNTKRTTFYSIAGHLFLRDLTLFKHFFKYNQVSRLITKAIYEILDFKFFTNNKNSLVKIKNNNFSENTKDYSFDRNKFMKNFPNQKAGVDSLLLDSYYSIIKMCKDENIKLILFSAPEDEEYVQAQLDKDKIKNIFKSSTDLYKNLVYLDYTPYGEFWEKKYEFWLKDSHHIFQDSLFTEEFTDDILLKTIEP
jgi:hypothetical protein